MGSYAKVIKVNDKKYIYPLYIDNTTFTLTPKRNFNNALTGFMTCLYEIGSFINKQDPTLSLPYRISTLDNRIGDLSYTYGSDDTIWTRAMKFMLSDIKWIIAWYTKHYAPQYNSI